MCVFTLNSVAKREPFSETTFWGEGGGKSNRPEIKWVSITARL